MSVDADEWDTVTAYAATCWVIMEENDFWAEQGRKDISFWTSVVASLMHKWCSDNYFSSPEYHRPDNRRFIRQIAQAERDVFQFLDHHRAFRVLRPFQENLENHLSEAAWKKAHQRWQKGRVNGEKKVHPLLIMWWKEWGNIEEIK